MALSLVHLKGNTYYIPSPANVGVYVENNEVILIDSGNDKEAGRQILRLLTQQGWNLKLIVNTHSNADHIGGNAFLQGKTGCRIASTRMEAVFINDPVLEPAILFGGYPHREMRNKFLMAPPSEVTDVISSTGKIPDTPLEAVALPGHFLGMIGVVTPDHVFFIADSLFPEHIINKYHLFFLWDVQAHLDTLDKLSSIDAELYIPSHGQPTADINPLIEVNRGKVYEIMDAIADICRQPVTTEGVLKRVCDLYQISLNVNQYLLVLSTIRSFLSYLWETGRLTSVFSHNEMKWVRQEG